jgi:hypothetical protein
MVAGREVDDSLLADLDDAAGRILAQPPVEVGDGGQQKHRQKRRSNKPRKEGNPKLRWTLTQKRAAKKLYSNWKASELSLKEFLQEKFPGNANSAREQGRRHIHTAERNLRKNPNWPDAMGG